MTTKIARICLAIVFAATLAITAVEPAHAAGPCSLARAAGNYSFTDNGTVIGVGPRTAVGTLTLDSRGNIPNGVATSSLNGSIAVETVSGTYTVNPDCSGNIDVKIYSGGTELFEITGAIAFDDDVKQIRGIFTSVTAPDGTVLLTVINLEARKQ